MEYMILATEGADDQAILCSFLKYMGYNSINDSLQNLDPFWQGLIPHFSKNMSYHAHKNLPYPYIFAGNDISIAVYQGQGTRLAQNLLDIMQNFPRYRHDISALGIIVDADTSPPADVARTYTEKLNSAFPAFPAFPGIVSSGHPHTGIYVWPDGLNRGTLETLLLNCASFIYPDHKAGSEYFIQQLDTKYKQHWKGSEAEKAAVAGIVSILRPGKANYASFARTDDKWVSQPGNVRKCGRNGEIPGMQN